MTNITTLRQSMAEERHYNDDDTRNLQVDDFATHWMPLPKPPKETHHD